MDTPDNSTEDFSPRPPCRIILTIAETGETLYVPMEWVRSWISLKQAHPTHGSARFLYSDGISLSSVDVVETAEQIDQQYEHSFEIK